MYLILGVAGLLVLVAAAATLIIIRRRRSRVHVEAAMPTGMPSNDLVPQGAGWSPMPSQPVGFAGQTAFPQQPPLAAPAPQPAGYWAPPSQFDATDGAGR